MVLDDGIVQFCIDLPLIWYENFQDFKDLWQKCMISSNFETACETKGSVNNETACREK